MLARALQDGYNNLSKSKERNTSSLDTKRDQVSECPSTADNKNRSLSNADIRRAPGRHQLPYPRLI